MAVEVHVEGVIRYGEFGAFVAAVQAYTEYASAAGYATPRVLQGVSGPMNLVRLVYRYETLAEYERHEARVVTDIDYRRSASAMPYAEGSISYTIYRDLE